MPTKNTTRWGYRAVSVACPTCGEMFLQRASKPVPLTCSAKCGYAFKKSKGWKPTPRPRTQYERLCETCGEPFMAPPSQKGRFCSFHCATIANNRARGFGLSPVHVRRQRMMKKHGKTLQDWNDLWAKQDGKCAICNQGMTDGGQSGASAHLDHDHVTGEVRGLLCSQCNLGLGKFGDDPGRLEAAALYVQGYRRVRTD